MENELQNIQATAVSLDSRKDIGFIAFAHARVGKLQGEGRFDAAHKLNAYIGRFITYLGKNDIPFKDFDSLLMHNYHTWLKKQGFG